jgi:hypothetical protein
MDRELEERPRSDDRDVQHIVSHLILKLRWIGLDEEANRLEAAALAIRPEDRGSVSYGPFSTD